MLKRTIESTVHEYDMRGVTYRTHQSTTTTYDESGGKNYHTSKMVFGRALNIDLDLDHEIFSIVVQNQEAVEKLLKEMEKICLLTTTTMAT